MAFPKACENPLSTYPSQTKAVYLVIRIAGTVNLYVHYVQVTYP